MKNSIQGKTLASVILFFSFGLIQGQNLNVKDPSTGSVYIQTDRSAYNSGGTIRFDAFILNDLSDTYKSGKDSLIVALIDENGLEVASETLPVAGFSTQGSLELSKFLNAGNYVLVAGTGKMKNVSPDRLFSRILEIHDPKASSAKVSISLPDRIYKPGDNLKADLLFTDKKDEPAQASFTYSLSDSKGTITKEKAKAGKDGHSVTDINLPEFQQGETLTLYISGSVKGADINAGIVLPTAQNNDEEKNYSTPQASAPDNLAIVLTTDRTEYRKSEEVTGNITVTGSDGKPLFANLSIGASGLNPKYFPLAKDNIITCSNLLSHDKGLDVTWSGILGQKGSSTFQSFRNIKRDNQALINPGIAEYLGKALATFSHLPGHCFANEEKNDIKKIERKQAAELKAGQTGYSADRDIFDIINRIRPFQLVDNKIMFSNVGNYSVNFQGGALIVIDGVKRGTDASILKNIPVTDIARVTATTSPSELQRYSAMNSSGLVEIVTKKGTDAAAKAAAAKKNTDILFWKPELSTDTSGKATFSYRNKDEAQDVSLTVEGITADGLTGTTTIHYKVK